MIRSRLNGGTKRRYIGLTVSAVVLIAVISYFVLRARDTSKAEVVIPKSARVLNEIKTAEDLGYRFKFELREEKHEGER